MRRQKSIIFKLSSSALLIIFIVQWLRVSLSQCDQNLCSIQTLKSIFSWDLCTHKSDLPHSKHWSTEYKSYHVEKTNQQKIFQLNAYSFIHICLKHASNVAKTHEYEIYNFFMWNEINVQYNVSFFVRLLCSFRMTTANDTVSFS